MTQIEYVILSQPRMLQNDNRRVTFTGYDKSTEREVVCQTAGTDDAPALLKKMQGWKEVLITGDYIPGGQGIMFRVDTIAPKAPQTAHN